MAHLKRNAIHRQPFLRHSQRWLDERRAQQRAHRDPMISALYSSKAWRTLRALVLAESGGQCSTPRCAFTATRVDHRVPHRGDYALFFDRENLSAMCQHCHDAKTARHDGGFGNPRRPYPR